MSLRIAQEMHVERTAQHALFGDANDDKWTPGEWSALICHYATRQAVNDLREVDHAKFRADMVKVGALAMAAIQAIERSREP